MLTKAWYSSEKGKTFVEEYKNTGARKKARDKFKKSPKGKLSNSRFKKSPRGKYAAHKQGAAKRGILFFLTFDQWWEIWKDSGLYTLRGAKSGCYCMARFGDEGPYAVGNVSIQCFVKNSKEGGVKGSQIKKLKLTQITDS